MNCKKLLLENMKADKLTTELRFNIASARALGFELLKIELTPDEDTARGRLFSSVVRKLKLLKKEGIIRFFATQSHFRDNATEAIYLLNKYPELTEELSDSDTPTDREIFVRL